MKTTQQNSGIWGSSTTTAWQEYIIFSVSPGNEKRLAETLEQFQIGHKTLVGSYKGEQEPAWIVNVNNFPQIKNLNLVSDQESILKLGKAGRGARLATLQFLDDKTADIDLGRLVVVTEKTAKAQDAWTFDPSTEIYWIAK